MLDLPRFAVIRFDIEADYWSLCSDRQTYEDAVLEFKRLRSKGTENLYLVGLAFLAGPSTNIEQS